MRIFIYPYNAASESAKLLSQATGYRRIKHNNSRYQPRVSDIVINWGSSSVPFVVGGILYNDPASVCIAKDKIMAFKALDRRDVTTVPWTNDKATADEWNKTNTVFVRSTATGHAGAGITIAPPLSDPLPAAPLYTRWIKSTSEWRVHVMTGRAFYVQRKVRDPAREPTNWRIRNHDNGFVFQHDNIDPPPPVIDAGVAAVAALDLDFGAVDIIWREQNNTAYVLEVNTAPGLSGVTLDKYKEEFERELGDF